jgi:phage protein D
MTAARTPIYELPRTPAQNDFETFFVPQFTVSIAQNERVPAKPLPLEVVRDVIQVTYRDSLEDIDSFDLLISNFESDLSHAALPLRTKYEPPSRPEFAELFDPGQQLELHMGYVNNMRLMLKGMILSLEPNFPESGGMTLSVRGLNALHRFRAQQHTYRWEGVKDSDIAYEIGRNAQSKDRPGINFAVRINETAKQRETPDPFVFMNNQYDIVFLLERARRRNYELVLVETDEQGRPDPHLYFGPSVTPAAPEYLLEWGRSLLSFRPNLTTANQVAEVVVVGWDRPRNKRIEGKATWSDLVPKRDSAEKARQEKLAAAFGNRREIVTDQPVRSDQEAASRAKELLRDIRKGMVEATGETVGLPNLRAGRKVEIRGLGERFDGIYYVTETTHSIGDGGYRTNFKARREMIEE